MNSCVYPRNAITPIFFDVFGYLIVSLQKRTARGGPQQTRLMVLVLRHTWPRGAVGQQSILALLSAVTSVLPPPLAYGKRGDLSTARVSLTDQRCVCVFVCLWRSEGQTGSGKSHTMFGSLADPDLHGVIPRSVQVSCCFTHTHTQPPPSSSLSANYNVHPECLTFICVCFCVCPCVCFCVCD